MNESVKCNEGQASENKSLIHTKVSRQIKREKKTSSLEVKQSKELNSGVPEHSSVQDTCCETGDKCDASSGKSPGKQKKDCGNDCKDAKHNKKLGVKGEVAAARFLERRGYEILERNWTCPAGEADLIARDEEWVVFVEVKTRSNLEKGFPSEAVTPRKRERYEKIAAHYMAQSDIADVPLRFDIIAILVMDSERAIIRHHLNAFQ